MVNVELEVPVKRIDEFKSNLKKTFPKAKAAFLF